MRVSPILLTRARAPSLLLALVMLACRYATTFPDDATLMSPALPYARWWAMTEACSGRTGNLEEVSWYVVPRAVIEEQGQSYDGVWYMGGNRIVLTKPSVLDGKLVRHEMLHALIRQRHQGHPPIDFIDRCGGIVSFNGGQTFAVASLLPEPVATSPVLLPRDMILKVEIDPVTPRVGLPDSGWVTTIVSITNPRAEPIWLRVPRVTRDQIFFDAFGADIGLPNGARRQIRYAVRDTIAKFGAHETKRHTFDEKLFPLPGSWRVRPVFARDTGAWLSFNVAP